MKRDNNRPKGGGGGGDGGATALISAANDRRAPDLAREAPTPIDEATRDALERALAAKVAAPLSAEARRGAAAAVVLAVIGSERRAHELFVFARDASSELALDRCVDALDGVVDELARALAGNQSERLLFPLDWEGRPFDGAIVFVRSEIRDYIAEEQAAALLGEQAPPRGLRSPPAR